MYILFGMFRGYMIWFFFCMYVCVCVQLQLGWHPVVVEQYVYAHKQYTQYKERNIHNNKKVNQFGKCVPYLVFASYILAFALQLRKKHGKPSVRVAARTSQADTVQFQNYEQYNTQKKNSNTEYYNVTEHWIHWIR
jgi:hypothetical protein